MRKTIIILFLAVFPLCFLHGTGQNGLLSYKLSNGIVILAQPRYELDFSWATVFYKVPSSYRNLPPEAYELMGTLYLDVAREGEECPRAQLAVLGAIPSFCFDGVYFELNLQSLPGNLPRALALMTDIFYGNRFSGNLLDQAVQKEKNKQAWNRLIGWRALKSSIAKDIYLTGGLPDSFPFHSYEKYARHLARLHDLLCRPENMKIALSGVIDSEKCAKEIVLISEKWKKRKNIQHKRIMIPKVKTTSFAEWNIPVRSPRVVIYINGPGLESTDFPAFMTACNLIGNGWSSLFSRLALVSKVEITGRTQCMLTADLAKSVFEMEIVGRVGSFDSFELDAFTAIRLLEMGRFSSSDVIRSKNQSFLDMAEQLGNFPIFHKMILKKSQKISKSFFVDFRKKLSRVTVKMLSSVAKKYMSFENCVVLELPGYKSPKRGFTEKSFRETMKGLLPIAVREALSWYKRQPKELLKLPPEDPLPQENPELRLSIVKSGILRGPEVLLSEKHRLPIIYGYILYPMKNLSDSMIAALSIYQRLTTKTGKIKSLRVKYIETLGGKIKVIYGAEFAGIEFECPYYFRIRLFKKLIELMHKGKYDPKRDFLSKPDPELVEARRSISPLEIASFEATCTLYGRNSPCFRNSFKKLDKITTEGLQKFYVSHIFRTIPSIAIVGEFQGTELLSAIASDISGSKFSNPARHLPLITFHKGKIPEIKLGGPVLICIEYPGAYPGDADIVRMQFLKRLFFSENKVELNKLTHMKGFIFRQNQLSIRGNVQLFFFGEGSDLPTMLKKITTYLDSLHKRAIGSWDLAAAARTTSLQNAILLSNDEKLCKWLALNLLWKSPFWNMSEWKKVLHKSNRETLRDLLRRTFNRETFGIGMVPLEGSTGRK